MARTNLSADETRQLILDEAERLFRDIGYEKTTIADIAAACGFSASNIYKHFGAKAQINEAICERMLRYKEETAMIAVRRETSAAGKLRAYLKSLNASTKELLVKEKRVHEMVLAAIDGRWDAVTAYRGRLKLTVQEIVAEGVRAGEFDGDDAEATGACVYRAAVSLLHPILVAESGYFDAENWDGPFIDYLIEGLARSPARE